jgi:hypothetical protein
VSAKKKNQTLLVEGPEIKVRRWGLAHGVRMIVFSPRIFRAVVDLYI